MCYILIKKETSTQVFPSEFCGIFKNTFILSQDYGLHLLPTEKKMKMGLHKRNYNEREMTEEPSTNWIPTQKLQIRSINTEIPFIF